MKKVDEPEVKSEDELYREAAKADSNSMDFDDSYVHDMRMKDIERRAAKRNYYYGNFAPLIALAVLFLFLVIVVWYPPDFIKCLMDEVRAAMVVSGVAGVWFTCLSVNRHANNYLREHDSSLRNMEKKLDAILSSVGENDGP